MIGPIISIGIIAILFLFYVISYQDKIVVGNINQELKNDVKYHEKRINNIYKLSEINGVYYECSQTYSCENLTEFIYNVTNCASSKGYYYKIHYDGQFYIYVNGFKDILSRRYLCG